jgi:hypothetical protein
MKARFAHSVCSTVGQRPVLAEKFHRPRNDATRGRGKRGARRGLVYEW